MRKALTTELRPEDTFSGMKKPTRIGGTRQPRRPHFIREWAEHRHYKSQAELAAALDADKSVVSRWYDGASPGPEWQLKLADLFGVEEPDAIFRHPDDDWLSKFFRDREAEEISRMKQLLELTFPRKSA